MRFEKEILFLTPLKTYSKELLTYVLKGFWFQEWTDGKLRRTEVGEALGET